MHSNLTRRQLMRKLAYAAPVAMASNWMSSRSGMAADKANSTGTYAEGLLPPGVRSRFVDGVNGLRMHVLEAGYEEGGRPGILLLHGFPELAYSWRNVMVPLAEAGFHVFAPDQRGYGRTTGWDGDYDGDLASFRRLNIVRDALGLVFALGHQSVAAVVGHDFGSPIAAWCAVIRPDVFQSVALMSAPFSGTPSLPSGTAIGLAVSAPLSSSSLPVARSTSRRSSSRVPATGAVIKIQAHSSECRTPPVPTCAVYTWLTAPGIGCSRNGRSEPLGC